MQDFTAIIGENIFAIIIAFIGLLGCLSFGLAGKGLMILYNESLSMTVSNHPFIKQIMLRRENGMRINNNVRNTYIFVLKNMERYKYLNLSINDYIKTAWLLQLMCVMLGLISGIIKENMWYTAYGCVCAIAVACVGKIEDVELRQQQVVVNIVDYFDNVLTFDRVNEEAGQRDMEMDYKSEKDSTQEDLGNKEKAKTQAAGNDIKEENIIISDEQRKLIEDVLREYLA